MIVVILVLLVVAAIMIAAVKIIMGWVLPRSTVVRINHFVDRAMMLYVKIVVVSLAGLIVFAFWIGSHDDRPSSAPQRPVAAAWSPDAWDPEDPDQEHTKVPITLAFAKKLMGAKTFADVQRMAGSKGKITERNAPDRVGYHWISDAKTGQAGFMLVVAFENGDFGASIVPGDMNGSIVVNNFGNFICDRCRPPIAICGRRPSWMKPDEPYCG